MAKVDSSVFAGLAGLASFAVALFLTKYRALRLLAVCVLSFVLLELLLLLSGFSVLRGIWWAIHLPSALLLGGDEILERHGRIVSTLAHVGDLLLWSVLIAVPLSIRKSRLTSSPGTKAANEEHPSESR